MRIKVNGNEVKWAGSYNENTFRIITLDDKVHDYKSSEVEIEFNGEEIDYHKNIRCLVTQSKSEFIGAKGRFNAPVIRESGIIRLIDFENNLDWIELQIDPGEVERVREIASKGMGSLLVDIGVSRLGNIIDSIEDMYWDEKEEQWCSKFDKVS